MAEELRGMLDSEVKRVVAAMRSKERVKPRVVLRIEGGDSALDLAMHPVAAIIQAGRAIEKNRPSAVALSLWDGSQPSALACVISPTVAIAVEIIPQPATAGWPLVHSCACPPALVGFFRRNLRPDDQHHVGGVA